MIEWLVLARTDFGRNGLPPFVGIVEYRVDIKNYAAERMDAVLDHLTDFELGVTHFFHAVYLGVTARSVCPFVDLWPPRALRGREAPLPASRWHHLASCLRSSPLQHHPAWPR